MATVKILSDIYARGEIVLKKDDVLELEGEELARIVRRRWGAVVESPPVVEPPKSKGKGKG